MFFLGDLSHFVHFVLFAKYMAFLPVTHVYIRKPANLSFVFSKSLLSRWPLWQSMTWGPTNAPQLHSVGRLQLLQLRLVTFETREEGAKLVLLYMFCLEK